MRWHKVVEECYAELASERGFRSKRPTIEQRLCYLLSPAPSPFSWLRPRLLRALPSAQSKSLCAPSRTPVINPQPVVQLRQWVTRQQDIYSTSGIAYITLLGLGDTMKNYNRKSKNILRQIVVRKRQDVSCIAFELSLLIYFAQ